MPRGDKTAETYDKVAETFKEKGDREWAKAKNDEGDFHFGFAKKFYNTSQKAAEKAEELRNKK